MATYRSKCCPGQPFVADKVALLCVNRKYAAQREALVTCLPRGVAL